ncbi:TPA: IS4 family transposase, partial [Candidatus Poribacteria bacterium]|nr:IS4 family transposase [Candidatus Poribacteria bacterium]
RKENVHAVKLHHAFELNRMIPVEFLLTEGKANEKKVLLNMAQAGVTYILDRGYFAFYLLQDLIAQDAFFLVRTREDLRYTIVSTLPITLPASVRPLFTNLTDQRIRCPNDPSRHIYRLITFECRNTPFLILTNRTDLTTFQIILLYAYRWQIELLFRFLKRSMGGLHLFNLAQEGLSTQFYLFLITAILELNLKQDATKTLEAHHQHSASQETQPDLSQKAPPSALEQKENTCSSPRSFLQTIGEKLHTYWKLSIYWRDTLRDLLARPYDQQTVFLLGST